MNTQPSQDTIDLFVGVAHGNLEKVQAMLAEHPSLLNARASDDGETALGAAAHVGNRPIAEFLLERGAPLDIFTAAMLPRPDAVIQLLDQDPTLIHTRGAHNVTLMYHVALGGDVTLAETIKDKGADSIHSALHGAVRRNNLAMAKWLVNNGADLTMHDFRNQTSLEAAIASGFTEMADYLRSVSDGLQTCPNCQETGSRIVSRLEGNRWEAHQTHYKCHLCEADMGYTSHEAGEPILSGKP